MRVPAMSPMRLGRRRGAFKHPDWLFEIKHDGFRALAYVNEDRCQLMSRNGNVFRQFDVLAAEIHSAVRSRPAVLDGEIVCLDEQGRSQFNDLLFRRSAPHFFAFDLPWLGGHDLRRWPLIDRKERLRSLLQARTGRLLYCDHIDREGEELFGLACQHDLEGIVAKRKDGEYTTGVLESTWLKVRNAGYSQMMGREELFGQKGRRSGRVSDGWAGCALACAERHMYAAG